jgi:hypothetical protein
LPSASELTRRTCAGKRSATKPPTRGKRRRCPEDESSCLEGKRGTYKRNLVDGDTNTALKPNHDLVGRTALVVWRFPRCDAAQRECTGGQRLHQNSVCTDPKLRTFSINCPDVIICVDLEADQNFIVGAAVGKCRPDGTAHERHFALVRQCNPSARACLGTPDVNDFCSAAARIAAVHHSVWARACLGTPDVNDFCSAAARIAAVHHSVWTSACLGTPDVNDLCSAAARIAAVHHSVWTSARLGTPDLNDFCSAAARIAAVHHSVWTSARLGTPDLDDFRSAAARIAAVHHSVWTSARLGAPDLNDFRSTASIAMGTTE